MTNTTMFAPIRPRHRSALLHGVSLSALLVAGTAAPRQADAAPLHSLTQALALASHAAQAAIAPSNAVTASQQAALGAHNLATAATRMRSLSDALATIASHGTGSSPIVVDGYGAGRGLQSAPGAVAGGATWQGAALPTTTPTSHGVTVTVAQSQPLAQLTWQTFNVGAKTTLNFDQSAGGKLAGSWVVINKVLDPQANGSQILGAINAQGKVYVLNRNGIAFTQGATVNVGSLIAATADIYAGQFTTTASGVTSFDLYGAQTTLADSVSHINRLYQPTFVNGTSAAITVAAGASIQTAAPTGTNGGGYVMLLGGNVANAGVISTPEGQTVLAAGTDFTLRQGSQGSTTAGNLGSTTIGSEVAATNYGINNATGFVTDQPYNTTYTTGSVANSGIVIADQGDISLVGHALTQAGVLVSTTTVNTRGTIHFLTPNDGTDTGASITLAPNSVTEILPEDNGLTALDSQRATNVAGSAVLNAYRTGGALTAPKLNNTSLLADQLGESRIELSSGGAVDVGQGALVVAQGGQIAVAGGSRVLLEAGANLDVSGTTNALLPASVNDILVNVQPFQLRDSAGNRTGALKGTNLYVDAATLVQIASGAFAGNIYTPGGLVEVAGYLGLIPHGIAEWTAIGGQVTLQASQVQITPPLTQTGSFKTATVSGTVITAPGSVINLQGGSVSYQPGMVNQSYVQAADGIVYNINDAPGNLVYAGVYTGQAVDHPRWKITQHFVNPLLTPATIEEPGYTVGRDAGSITINAGTDALQGNIYAGVTLGQYQVGPRPGNATDPYLLAQTVVPQAGSLAFGNYVTGVLQTLTTQTQIVFQATPGAAVLAPVPGSAIIDAAMLDAGDFANLAFSTGGSISVGAPLSVANGGSISLTGAILSVGADITARGGAITLTDQLTTHSTSGGTTVATSVPVAFTTGITLGSAATLDTRGVWTNALTDPGHLAGLGLANGGSVTIASSNGVTLQAGSRIDVSSGGALLANGAQMTGKGGSVAVVADIDIVPNSGLLNLAPVVLDSSFVGYGSSGGGTLSLTAPEFRIGGSAPGPFITVVLDPALFSSGFAKYVVDGTAQLSVSPGTQIGVTEPIYLLDQGLTTPTGGDPSRAYSVVLPTLYTPAKGSDVLTQRAGASISLFSSAGPATPLTGDGGPVTIGAGATLAVDPGQSIVVAGYGQVSVFGTLTAHGGSVQVANTSYGVDQSIPNDLLATQYQPGVSVWLGAQSVIDVSGQAAVQTDQAGHSFGLAGSGGTIQIGSLAAATPTLAEVIVRPGAVLDADGAQQSVTEIPGTVAGTLLQPAHPVTLVGNGGTVALGSAVGIALDSTPTARAGGAGAAGGLLSLTLDPINLGAFSNIPTYVYQPREILVTQTTLPVQPPGVLPGVPSFADTYGRVRVSQQQVDAGGFASLALSAEGAEIVFQGSVDLHAARSIGLASGVIGATSTTESVSIAAPYVSLVGETFTETQNDGTTAPPVSLSLARLHVQADLIDIADSVYLGGGEQVSPGSTGTGTGSNPGTASGTGGTIALGPPAAGVTTSSFGFGQADFDSTGDIRFLGDSSDNRGAMLLSLGNLGFQGAQLYPVSAANATVVAGYNPQASNTTPESRGGTIAITGTGSVPQGPYSVGGRLQFDADTIVQAGIVRAPEGTLVFSDGSNDSAVYYPSHVTFAPGSVTSVSLAGQTIPYGGTVDGVTYTAPYGTAFQPSVQVQAQSVDVQAGATIDLRGGGTLSGAGFVFGRGGSADVLTTPLLDSSGGAAVANAQAQVAAIAPVRSGDPVYAILPGYASSYAPAAGTADAGYTATRVGEQITVGANEVPGLAAGTYTLLPAYYALLPGGYRVELTSGTLPVQGAIAQGNFTSLGAVTVSFANTAISSPVATAALFTSGTDVRQLSQYDEESFNSFEAASATQFGDPRPFLPQDAKTLELIYPGLPTTSGQPGTPPALSIAPSALLQAPDAGGYGATLEITSMLPIVVAGAGDVAPPRSLVLSAATLDALDMPRLVLGGTLTTSSSAPDTIDVNALAPSVDILGHADLTAGDILITTLATGTITLAPGGTLAPDGTLIPGGTLSTIGAAHAAYDVTNGYLFNNEFTTGQAYPVLDVSNGQVVFTPNTDAAQGASINVGDRSGLLAGGSLDIVAPSNTVVTIGGANLGARYASIAVAAINIGNQATLDGFAGQLPSGLSLTPQALATLLNGSAALGTPAAAVLTLTATQEVNLLGSVALDTGGTDLVLNTPAIYGVGNSSDIASITAGKFTWSGVATLAPLALNPDGGIAASALPGGQIAAGLGGQTSGSLQITAGTIVLGYGPQTQPNDQLMLDRVVTGFGSVTLTGTAEITANNQSALSVFATQTAFGQPGTGGNLSLVTPLVTTASGGLLQLTAGGNLSLSNGGTIAAINTVATLGGEIDLTAGSVALNTAIALPAGRLTATAQGGIDVSGSAAIDLSGRAVHLFDQTAYIPGGTLGFESTAGSIVLETGSRIDVSATGTAAGSVGFSALAGGVALDGTLLGKAGAGQTGGAFTVTAGTLATTTQAGNVAAGGSAFDNINAALNTGGFTGGRSFEIGTDIGPSGVASTDIVIGNDTAGASLLVGHTVSVTADKGSIDVTGSIDAAGTGPGAIALSAAQNLTLEATALLDAHATQTATDSTGAPIDAENRAHVTLTSTAGTLTLNGGTIDLGYPDAAASPQGQLVLNAMRVGTDDVAISAAAPISVTGAQSIALYAWRDYMPTDVNGTVVQDNTDHSAPHGYLSLDAVNQASQAFIAAAGANTDLAARLAGLVGAAPTPAAFHLRPGVEIDSEPAGAPVPGSTTQTYTANLTITGDVDLSSFRYSDVGYGSAVVPGSYGSGEAGALLFRAGNDLVVNGSVSDGFAPPPDSKAANYLKADNDWVILAPGVNNFNRASDALGADVILPSSITVTTTSANGNHTIILHQIELAAGTTFDESRAVSLNYAITVASANISANVVIPFGATIDPASGSLIVPQGGFVTTAAIISPTGAVTAAGTYLPGGTVIAGGSSFAAGSSFPVAVQVANNTVVPAGTLLSIFDDSTLTLSANTAVLPVNALIPSDTVPEFITASGLAVTRLELRPQTADADGNLVQGYLYALAKLLPAGAQSWNLDFVAGANHASADVAALIPRSVLDGGALAAPANTANQAPGSLILDDQHTLVATLNPFTANPAFSVIRTGTGDLSLMAGGDFDQSSLYGIYTAGTQDPLAGGSQANAPYNLAREGYFGHKEVLPGGFATANAIIDSTYQANYPNDGGDLVLSAQGSVTGDLYGGEVAQSNIGPVTSDAIGNWLWRQGSTQLGQATAWWINFGTLAYTYSTQDQATNGLPPELVGFQGIGALGGGNVTVSAGQNAGQTTDRSGAAIPGAARGEGLVIAIGSTGREITSNGTQSIVQTGGGNLTLHVGGTLNPIDAQAYSGSTGASLNGPNGSTLNGALIDLRGNITVAAGAVGRLDETYASSSPVNEPDPRPISPYTPILTASDGVTVVPGDGSVAITTDRDTVLDGVGDAGRVTEQSLTRVSQSQVGTLTSIGGATGFTLWTADTAVSLTSAGGNVAPITVSQVPTTSLQLPVNDAATDGRFVYPSQLYVTVATGNIAYGNANSANVLSLETMPSANEQVSFLAGGSIQGNGLPIDLSGADPAGLSTPLDPAFSSNQGALAGEALTNIRNGAGTTQSILALFALEADTPTTNYLSAHATPALFYAAGGDILDFITGETLTFNTVAQNGTSGVTQETLPQWYLAAKPVRIIAAEDIINSGTRPNAPAGTLQQNQSTAGGSPFYTASGNLFLNDTPGAISVVSAGRDILSGYFYVGGSGLLEVDAGRNIQQIGYSAPANGGGTRQLLDYGSIKSLGSLLSGAPVSLTGGAGLDVSAGLGTGADYTGFAELYLNPANQANLALPITDPGNAGKVQQVYSAQLLTFLQQNYAYTGSSADALAFFLNPANVPVATQDVVLRSIFYAELLASGQQYNDAGSRFHLSYTRGRQAIDALLPGQNGSATADGAPAGYVGAITMASGQVTASGSAALFDAGIATEHGGDIDVLDPGGQVVLGTSGGAAPGGGTGIITNGSGNIALFSLGSVLLGQSRIFTNAGGNIQIWSAAGDINAGIGARTTVVYNPPIISYDNAGGLVETPGVPTSGAGIATEQPLPSIPAGNIDLTAPLGTIDAGEAGVRSSGNLNLAAARLANTAGFSAGGKTSGNSAPASVSLGAVEAAGAAAGAGQQAAQNLSGSHTENQLPSIIEVEVLSVGGETDEEKRRKRK